MSIKGFTVDGETQRYDYNALDNLPSIPGPIAVDSELSSASENPVQNKVVKEALDKKVDAVSGKGLSTNDYSTEDKNKLSGIEAGAQKNPDLSHYVTDSDYNPAAKTSSMTQPVGVDADGKLWTAPSGGSGSVTVDGALSDTSENPVQNKVVKAALDAKLAANQGAANAGKFLVVGSDGVVAPVTMQTWQGGSY